MEKNNIYLGNAYELIKEIPNKSVDLIMTDPPYLFDTKENRTGIFKTRNTTTTHFEEIRDCNLGNGIDLSILDEFVRVMKKINIYIWCNKEQIYDYITYFVKERKCMFEIIVWGKTNPPPFLCGHYLKDKEYCLYFWQQGVSINPKYNTGKTIYITTINMEDKRNWGHPTCKPVDIISNLIENSTKEGDLVLDAFAGSGSTCVACRNLKRDYIAFEINPKYYKLSQERLKGFKVDGTMDLFSMPTED